MLGDPSGTETKKAISERMAVIDAAIATVSLSINSSKLKKEQEYQRDAFKRDMNILLDRVKSDVENDNPSRLEERIRELNQLRDKYPSLDSAADCFVLEPKAMPAYIETVDAELASIKLLRDKKKALETKTVKEEAKAINSLV